MKASEYTTEANSAPGSARWLCGSDQGVQGDLARGRSDLGRDLPSTISGRDTRPEEEIAHLGAHRKRLSRNCFFRAIRSAILRFGKRLFCGPHRRLDGLGGLEQHREIERHQINDLVAGYRGRERLSAQFLAIRTGRRAAETGLLPLLHQWNMHGQRTRSTCQPAHPPSQPARRSRDRAGSGEAAAGRAAAFSARAAADHAKSRRLAACFHPPPF